MKSIHNFNSTTLNNLQNDNVLFSNAVSNYFPIIKMWSHQVNDKFPEQRTVKTQTGSSNQPKRCAHFLHLQRDVFFKF